MRDLLEGERSLFCFVEQYIFNDWSNELDIMNYGKVGRPFRYAETYIKLLAYIRYHFNLPYR